MTFQYICKSDDMKTDRKYWFDDEALYWQEEGQSQVRYLYENITKVQLSKNESGYSHSSSATLVDDVGGNTVNVISNNNQQSNNNINSASYCGMHIITADREIVIDCKPGRDGKEYTKFVAALHQSMQTHLPASVFMQGSKAVVISLSILLVVIVTGLLYLAVSLLLDGGWIFSIIPAVISLIAVFIITKLVMKLRPKQYDPLNLPQELMPCES